MTPSVFYKYPFLKPALPKESDFGEEIRLEHHQYLDFQYALSIRGPHAYITLR